MSADINNFRLLIYKNVGDDCIKESIDYERIIKRFIINRELLLKMY